MVPEHIFVAVEGLGVSVRHIVARSEVVVVADDTLAGMAYKVEVGVEEACSDGCICEVAVFCLGEERIAFVAALCSVSACIGVADELYMSILSSVSLEDFSFAAERMNCETALLSLCALLKGHLVLTISKSFREHYESVFCSDEELSVCFWAHFLVNP